MADREEVSKAVALFDVQVEFGSASAGARYVVSAQELTAEMARTGIYRALVRMGPEALSPDFLRANRLLYETCSSDRALVPCPVVVPNAAHDLPTEEEQVAEAIDRGSAAVSLRPGHDYWSLDQWVCGRLLEVLQERRMSVFCLERMFSPTAVADLAARYPRLPIIYAEGSYSALRIYLPLMERFRNIHLSLGNNVHFHRGIEKILETVSADQLLFGTGFPTAEPMAAVTQLMYADLSDETKGRIGSGNMERLMKEIVHG